MLTYDRYVVPGSLTEVFNILDADPASRILAGATDILPWARYGRAGDVHLSYVIDISKVPEFKYIERSGDSLSFGSMTTIADFQNNPILRQYAPVLAQCAVWFADDQIREQATVGGNVVNASPAGDSQPALLALNTSVQLIRREGGKIIQRSIPLEEFIQGPGKTAMLPKELLLGFKCDAMGSCGSAYEKVGHRRSLVISTVCLAVVAVSSPDHSSLSDIRIGIGAVGPVPKRLVNLEAALIGQKVTGEIVRKIAEQASEFVLSRSRQEYRKVVLVNFVERAIIAAINKCGIKLARLAEEQICV